MPKIKSLRKSKFRIGQWVKTKSGLRGKIIGSAEYRYGWDYRIKVPGRAKTMYRHEQDLKASPNK